MKAIIDEISDYLACAEERTINNFMRLVDKGDARSFRSAGYTIIQQKLKDGIDGIMLWRMTLMHHDCEIIHQDIEIILKITME